MGGGTLTQEQGGYLQEDGVLDLSNSTLALSGPFHNYDNGTLTTSASTLRLNANVKFDPNTAVTFDAYEPYGWGLVLPDNNSNLTIGGNVSLQPSAESLTSGFVDHYSPGATWTSRTSGTTKYLLGATYRNSIIVEVGQSGTILTSSDGTSWT